MIVRVTCAFSTLLNMVWESKGGREKVGINNNENSTYLAVWPTICRVTDKIISLVDIRMRISWLMFFQTK